jgi:hypothetical protein
MAIPEKSELSKFFFGKTKASKKDKDTAGCGQCGRTRPCIFCRLAFVFHKQNLENSEVGASSRRWFLTGG